MTIFASQKVMTNRQLTVRRIIALLGGPSELARIIGCSAALIIYWQDGTRRIRPDYARKLQKMLQSISGELPQLIFALKEIEKQEEITSNLITAKRKAVYAERFSPARRDKSLLTVEQRKSNHARNRLISRLLRGGADPAKLAQEYGVSEHAIERWGRRGGGLV